MKRKIAVITGVTGQDGAYLSDLLIDKGYEVHGFKRRSSTINTARIDHHFSELQDQKKPFYLHYNDLTDTTNIFRLLKEIKPNEIYNLAAQSHVAVSFEMPEYTANADAIGTLRLLESIQNLELKETKFYQASTSEMFGKVKEVPQTENTSFHPRSPYGVAKLYAHWITKNYREAYNMFASNGILFNHESPLRGETFVTRKIAIALAKIKAGLQNCLYLGNIDAKRDWGHAKDFVEAQWLILQYEKPDDFVIATGEQYSVREFTERCASYIDMKIKWEGKGDDEKGYDEKGRCVVQIDKRYKRKAEVDTLLGDASKARKLLNWEPKISFDNLVKEMMESEIKYYYNK